MKLEKNKADGIKSPQNNSTRISEKVMKKLTRKGCWTHLEEAPKTCDTFKEMEVVVIAKNKNLRLGGKRDTNNRMEVVDCWPGSKEEKQYDNFWIHCDTEDRDERTKMIEQRRFKYLNERRDLRYLRNRGHRFLRDAAKLNLVWDSIEADPIDEDESSLRAVLVEQTITRTYLIELQNMEYAGNTEPSKKMMKDVQKTSLGGY